jgi:glycine oxidase
MRQYNQSVSTRSYDAVVVGGGVIGLSLALRLRRELRKVVVLEVGRSGQASYAAAGMLNADDCTEPKQLRALARESAALYPAFVEEFQSASGAKVDFQRSGALVVGGEIGESIAPDKVRTFEPSLSPQMAGVRFVQEDFVEPRSLLAALIKAAQAIGVDVVSQEARGISREREVCTGIVGDKQSYSAGLVVNCAGAWAEDIAGIPIPSRPIKGQMLSMRHSNLHLEHVLRWPEQDVYMLPRATGIIAIGATVEDVGFDTHVDTLAIADLRSKAEQLIPALAQADVVETWAGLRPGTPDKLPIMGETHIRNYFVSTGHYRSGILLAPASAVAMSELILNGRTSFDLQPFSPRRFARNEAA